MDLGCITVHVFVLFTQSHLPRCTSLITLQECPLLAEPLKQAELKALDHLESAMELVYYQIKIPLQMFDVTFCM